MTTPISALQRNAAAVIRKVAASGIAEEITDRGRVVGVLGPPPELSGLERLRQAGATRPAVSGAMAQGLALTTHLPEIGLVEALAEQRDDGGR
jgi:hypothetical protein